MTEKVLFVDDDLNLLASMERQLSGQFHIETALSGESGLRLLNSQGPFAVVVTDMHVPDMNGLRFLSRVRERSPDSVGIILTGYADPQMALNAVNEGGVFRFLTKPCPPEILARSISAGLRQYQLITTEKELLRKTLFGGVKILIELLRLINPTILRYTSRITHYAKMIATRLEFPNTWQIGLAAMLSQIGCLALSPSIVDKITAGQGLYLLEQQMYSSHPSIGAEFVANIPRLEPVAFMIEQQQKLFKNYTPLEEMTQKSMIDLGAQILKVSIALDQMLVRGYKYEQALARLSDRPDEYNPKIVNALRGPKMARVQFPNQGFLSDSHGVEGFDADEQERIVIESSSGATMAGKVLFVDDDSNVLASMERQLSEQFHIETALNGEHGLSLLDSQGPFAVVVADMRIPDMDGISFLNRVKEHSPDSVCIMLTGHADLQMAIDAVNEGNIFRFLIKPCPSEILARSLNAGLRQYQLITTEKGLPQKTLFGNIKTLTEILRLVNPVLFSCTSCITYYAKMIATRLEFPNTWQIELAAMLSQIGCLALSSSILNKVNTGHELSLSEQRMYSSHPSIAAELVTNIPRLESVTRMIEQQQKLFKDYTPQEEMTQESMIDLGSQILKVAIAIDQMLVRGYVYEEASSELRDCPDDYNPRVVTAFESLQMARVMYLSTDALGESHAPDKTHKVEGIKEYAMITRLEDIEKSMAAEQKAESSQKGQADENYKEADQHIEKVRPLNLRISMAMDEDIRAKDGTLLLSKGQQVSPLLQYVIERLSNLFHTGSNKAEKADQTGKDQPPEETLSQVVDRDVRTNDGHLLLSRGQETTPLMQHILRHSGDLLKLGNYRIVQIDEMDNVQDLDQKKGKVLFSVEDQEKPESKFIQSILERVQGILQRKEYEIGNVEVEIRQVELGELKSGMVTQEDIYTNNGTLLLSRGQEISKDNLERLYRFSQTAGIKGTDFSILKKVDA